MHACSGLLKFVGGHLGATSVSGYELTDEFRTGGFLLTLGANNYILTLGTITTAYSLILFIHSFIQ